MSKAELEAFLDHLRAEGHDPTVDATGRLAVSTTATPSTVSLAFSEPCACVTLYWGHLDMATLHLVSDDHGETFTPEAVTWTGLFDLLGVSA